MGKILSGFNDHFLFAFRSSGTNDRREIAVREITGLMAIVILIAALVISVGILAGFFVFQETLPIYILLSLIVPAWWVARNGGWKWVSYLPALMCFALGLTGQASSGFTSLPVLFYALSVVLAGMLIGTPFSFLMLLVSTLSYAFAGDYRVGFTIDRLPQIITFTFSLSGLELLRWYAHYSLQAALEAQIQGNKQLKAEIVRREQAELAQKAQEILFRRLAENATDLVAELDFNGVLRYASPSYQSVLGFDPHALIGTDGFELLHPEDRQAAREIAQAAAANGEQRRVQIRCRRADGQYIWIEISGRPVYGELGEFSGFVIASRDINMQKQAEIANQESERKFRTIIESLPLGVHLYTLQDDGSLIFSGFNPAAEKILRVDHSHFLGSKLENAFPNLVEDGTAKHYHEIAQLGGHWAKNQLYYSDSAIQGAFEVHAFQTEPGKMVAVFSDITQRINDLEALHTSEEKFSTAFFISPDSVNINRLSDGVYLDINQGFTQLTGYTREDSIGRSSLELNIWDNPNDRNRLVNGLRENGVVKNLEARFRRKNGDIAIGLMSASIMPIQGEPCILSITRDITDWLKAQDDLRETHVQLEQAYEATLLGWAHALTLRERETAEHSRRVVEQTLCIAREVGISGDDLVHIQRGTLLHDIGKMGIPDHILLKPGRLTSDEWVTMRQHPEFARAMLEEIEYLHPSIEIPYCHHEKWDGTGYPRGLKGEDIPLPARIFAIVDVYDALTNDRPYRPAWSEAEAQRYLIDEKDKQFDPQLVDLFLRIIAK